MGLSLFQRAKGNLNFKDALGKWNEAVYSTEHKLQIWSCNPTSGHISREKHKLKSNMHPDVHIGSIYTSQDMEAT